MNTDCDTTVNEIIKSFCSVRDPSVINKNRLTDVYDILKKNWLVGHFYIELEGIGCHHCIIYKISKDTVEITDSFINYRQKETRIFKYYEFHDLLLSLILKDRVNLEQRKLCYDLLFNPPIPYVDNWDGKISKIYLEQLN